MKTYGDITKTQEFEKSNVSIMICIQQNKYSNKYYCKRHNIYCKLGKGKLAKNEKKEKNQI